MDLVTGGHGWTIRRQPGLTDHLKRYRKAVHPRVQQTFCQATFAWTASGVNTSTMPLLGQGVCIQAHSSTAYKVHIDMKGLSKLTQFNNHVSHDHSNLYDKHSVHIVFTISNFMFGPCKAMLTLSSDRAHEFHTYMSQAIDSAAIFPLTWNYLMKDSGTEATLSSCERTMPLSLTWLFYDVLWYSRIHLNWLFHTSCCWGSSRFILELLGASRTHAHTVSYSKLFQSEWWWKPSRVPGILGMLILRFPTLILSAQNITLAHTCQQLNHCILHFSLSLSLSLSSAIMYSASLHRIHKKTLDPSHPKFVSTNLSSGLSKSCSACILRAAFSKLAAKAP